MPEMRPVTIRFGDSLWSLIEDEANQDGVSAAHWIRDACLARAMWERRRRGIQLGPDILGLVREEHRAEDETFQAVVAEVLEQARPELDQIIGKVSPACADAIRRWYGL